MQNVSVHVVPAEAGTVADGPTEGLGFTCSNSDIDETATDHREFVLDHKESAKKVGAIFLDLFESVTHAVIDSRETVTQGLWPIIVKKDVEKYLGWLAFACEHPSRRKRDAMDVEEMIQKWEPLVKKLALAHDVDEKDLASAALDDLLKEIVMAPVKQVREFYRGLTKALKADKEVPWTLWKLFDFWGENILDKLESEQEMVLRGELAQQIAERSIEQIPVKDWVDAMIGALMWRSPEKLEQVKAKLDEGHKPRVKGRESCLFLQVAESEVLL